ncbi:SDR family NAD(P)-dependent oxidoreductase [Enemella sp. A6]|uniref:SDR family NAD(P)-dependent oxidoreductase n=1 Tax=Enemella sp. A6 TaxID=3440152 RepID=UPI003EB6987B
MDKLLDGRAVVITGSGRGLGRAYALAAAAEGAAVVVNDLDRDAANDTVAEITNSGGRAIAGVQDVSDWDAAGELINLCVDSFGAIDGLVNNAGVLRINRPEEQTRRDTLDVVNSSVIGTVACTTHALQHMCAAGRGVIVNVTSGQQMGAPAMAVYGAAKAAVATLTYSWSHDLVAEGVRVNAISPNAHTRMADAYEEFLGPRAAGQNVGISPELNAPLVVYLLSELSDGVSGQVFRFDGQSLMVCSHPAVIDRDAYLPPECTARDIASVVASELTGLFQPVGLRRIKPPEFS